MMIISIKNKIIILAIILLIFISASTYSCYYLYNLNFRTNEQLSEKINLLNGLYQKINQTKKNKEKNQLTENQKQQIDGLFLSKDPEKFLSFVVSLENLAIKNKLVMSKQIGLLDESIYPNIKNTPLTILVNGSYVDIIIFLAELQKLPQILNIHVFEVKSSATGTEANLQIDTYWEK